MEEVYFDNAATTKPLPEVVEVIKKTLVEDYGNPSSLHRKGMKAEEYIHRTVDALASVLKVDKNEIYFTSGGTESNNLAIKGAAKAYQKQGMHIITTQVEHPSVLEPIAYLEKKGYEVTRISVNNRGTVNLDELKESIRQDTILVSIMHINNEVGAVQPIDKIGTMIKAINKNTLFHVDGIQSFGKMEVQPKRQNIDLFSFSGHKIHGPKGIGGVYIRKGVKVRPIIHGGMHQRGIRSGTENLPGIAGLGIAAEKAYAQLKENQDKVTELQRFFIEQVKFIGDVTFHTPLDLNFAPHILNIGFENVRGEVLLHALEDKKIYISTGSACSTNKPRPSQTLTSMGLAGDQIQSAVRFSFSKYNSKEEVEYCIAQLQNIVPKLRKYTRG